MRLTLITRYTKKDVQRRKNSTFVTQVRLNRITVCCDKLASSVAVPTRVVTDWQYYTP
jgi:hypothetical protein